MSRPTTQLCTSTVDDIMVHGRSLPHHWMGNASFTTLIFMHLTGHEPTSAQVRLLDACLLAVMEHGMTPSAVTARLTYTGAPEAMQGAIGAGLAGVGSLFVGTMDGCAELLTRIVAADDAGTEAATIARDARQAGARLPGFGHPIHRPVDPRTVRLLQLARDEGTYGAHCAALEQLEHAVSEQAGKPVPANATGAIAAVLLDCDVPAEILRGVALIARCAGLVGHIREEQQNPTLNALWHAAEQAVPYAPDSKEEP